MALGLTQPLAKMSTRNISWGVKAAGAYGWQPYHLHVSIVLKSGNLSLLEPSGPVQDCDGIALPLPSSSSSSSSSSNHRFYGLEWALASSVVVVNVSDDFFFIFCCSGITSSFYLFIYLFVVPLT